MNQKMLALVPPTHLLKGPEPNQHNPLLLLLVDFCDYFTNEPAAHYRDWYDRQDHFHQLLKAISSCDIQLSVQLIEEGKTKFGALRIRGVKPNLWRSERYYTLLVNLYDAQVLKESNIKQMQNDIKGSDLEKYLNQQYFYGAKSLFVPKDKAAVTYDDAVFLSNKFLDFFSIPKDYVPSRALPPAVEAVSEAAPRLPVNRSNLSLSEQTQRKMHGMNYLERKMCELSQATLQNESERQQVTKKWEELQKKFQPKSNTVVSTTYLEPPAEAPLVHSPYGSNPNRFMPLTPACTVPVSTVQQIEPIIYHYPSGTAIQWDKMNL